MIDPRTGTIERSETVKATTPWATGTNTTAPARITLGDPTSVVILIREKNAVRALITYPYHRAVSLFSALDALPVIAEVTVPATGEPRDVRAVSVSPDPISELICCTWTAGGKTYAIAVDARTGRELSARAQGTIVHLTWGDRQLRVDMTTGKCTLVRAEKRTGQRQGQRGQQQGGQQARQGGQQGQQQRQGGSHRGLPIPVPPTLPRPRRRR